MTTMFKLVCESCGLTTREVARFLDAKIDTVKSWSSGCNAAPENVIEKLTWLAVCIDVAAREELLRIEESRAGQGLPEKIEIRITADDAEAQTLGWPCAGTHRAIVRNVIELAPDDVKHRIVLVPCGSTPATAAAADAHGH